MLPYNTTYSIFTAPHWNTDNTLITKKSIRYCASKENYFYRIWSLDELPEFKRTVLEVLRQPMEERRVTISRAKMTIDYPASFMLIAAMNPCPCGYYNHPTIACTCPPGTVKRYLNKVSGPLMDRIDIQDGIIDTRKVA